VDLVQFYTQSTYLPRNEVYWNVDGDRQSFYYCQLLLCV